MKIKLLIVEDETVISMDMTDMLEDIGYDVVDTASDYTEAISILESNEIDLVLVDITLNGEKDGIDLAKEIRESYNLPFIFLTSHSDKATVVAAASTKPNGYLTKPFEIGGVYAAIETALANFSSITENSELLVKDSIFIKSNQAFLKVKFVDIMWLEAEGNYIKVVTENGKHLVRSSFNSFLENFPKDTFIKVHKSYHVNINKVDAVNQTFIIINGNEIPVSRNYKNQLNKGLNRVI